MSDDVGFNDAPVAHRPRERFDLRCPDCGDFLRLRDLGPDKLFYGCRRWADTGCKANHGANPDGSPRGIPADAETRKWRTEAHRVFDRLWTAPDPMMTKTAAYEWLRGAFSLSEANGHIGMFTKDQCVELIRLVKQRWPQYQNVWDRLLGDSF